MFKSLLGGAAILHMRTNTSEAPDNRHQASGSTACIEIFRVRPASDGFFLALFLAGHDFIFLNVAHYFDHAFIDMADVGVG